MKQDRKKAEALFESLSLNLPAMAQIIKKKGRGRDTVLAHITPDEAKLLKKRGGRGSINPDTGLLEFEDYYSGEYMGAPDYSQAAAPTVQYEPSGGGYTYTPEERSYFSDINVPVSPYAQSESYAPGIDFSQYTGPGIQAQPTTTYAQPTPGAAGVQLPSTALTSITPPSFMETPTAAPGAVTPEAEAPTKPVPDISLLKRLQNLTGLSGQELARLGLAGGVGLYGLGQQKKAAKQISRQQAEMANIGKPYQAQGQELIRQAQAGELTPQSQQALEAARAQIQQGIESRGGVGTAQAANQIASIYQNLLNNQFNYGLQVSQIGDQIALGAIKTGLQLDTQLSTASQNFAQQLAFFAAGGTPTPTTTQATRPPIG